jgi:hypothetical protein
MKQLIFVLIAALLPSCTNQKSEESKPMPSPGKFDPQTLVVTEPADSGLKGQLLYMPVYSNIPYHIVGMNEFDMSTFVKNNKIAEFRVNVKITFEVLT